MFYFYNLAVGLKKRPVRRGSNDGEAEVHPSTKIYRIRWVRRLRETWVDSARLGGLNQCIELVPKIIYYFFTFDNNLSVGLKKVGW